MPIRTFFLKLRRKRLLLLGAVCLPVLLTAIALYLCLPMPQGAALDGVSLSGLPYWKARAEANTRPLSYTLIVKRRLETCLV